MRDTAMRTLSVAMAAAMVITPVAARAEREDGGGANQLRNIPVTGTVTGTIDGTPDGGPGSGQTFNGTLDIERFQEVGGQLFAIGQLSGKVGKKTLNHQSVALPVTQVNGTTTGAAAGEGFGGLGAARQARLKYGGNPLVIPAQTCPILRLVLGPLNLNLLGLVVTLNQVNLNITAQGGAGNLLGNLLCGVANLLNGLGTLTQLTNLLNAVANLLNGGLGL